MQLEMHNIILIFNQKDSRRKHISILANNFKLPLLKNHEY